MDSIKDTFDKLALDAKAKNIFLELMIREGESMSLGYQKAKLEKYQSSQNKIAGFRVLKNGQQAYSYTENLTPEGIEKSYREALSNLQYLFDCGLSSKKSPIPRAYQKISHQMPIEKVDVEFLKQKAAELESEAVQVDSRISLVPYSQMSESLAKARLLNSNGLDANFEQQFFSAYSYPLAKQDEASKMSGLSLTKRQIAEINTKTLAQEAAKNSLALLGPKKIPSGNYAVVLSSEVASTMMGLMADFFSAKAVDENKSILRGKLNQAVASSRLSLRDDPHYKLGTAYRPFDAEGETTQAVPLIEKGVLKNYLTNLEYAEKLNLPHTASAARSPSSEMEISCSNLLVEKGDQSLDQLLAAQDEVLYLTEITGLHSGFNESTGDFSLPGQGFLYKGGQRQHPVDQFIISGNILQMLTDVVGVGSEYSPYLSSVFSPALAIRSLSLAS